VFASEHSYYITQNSRTLQTHAGCFGMKYLSPNDPPDPKSNVGRPRCRRSHRGLRCLRRQSHRWW